MAEKSIGEKIYGALQGLEWPCRAQNYISTDPDDIYLVYYPTGQDSAVDASCLSRRQIQRAQVSIYATQALGDEILTVARALKTAGLRVTSFGSQAYDSATGMYGAPIMVEWAVRAEQML